MQQHAKDEEETRSYTIQGRNRIEIISLRIILKTYLESLSKLILEILFAFRLDLAISFFGYNSNNALK